MFINYVTVKLVGVLKNWYIDSFIFGQNAIFSSFDGGAYLPLIMQAYSMYCTSGNALFSLKATVSSAVFAISRRLMKPRSEGSIDDQFV